MLSAFGLISKWIFMKFLSLFLIHLFILFRAITTPTRSFIMTTWLQLKRTILTAKSLILEGSELPDLVAFFEVRSGIRRKRPDIKAGRILLLAVVKEIGGGVVYHSNIEAVFFRKILNYLKVKRRTSWFVMKRQLRTHMVLRGGLAEPLRGRGGILGHALAVHIHLAQLVLRLGIAADGTADEPQVATPATAPALPVAPPPGADPRPDPAAVEAARHELGELIRLGDISALPWLEAHGETLLRAGNGCIRLRRAERREKFERWKRKVTLSSSMSIHPKRKSASSSVAVYSEYTS